MKRTLLTVISICLILASVFGIYASSTGLADISGILRGKHIQSHDISDAIALISEQVKELDEKAEKNSEAEQKYAEGLVTDIEGNEKINDGEAQINAGEATLAKGQAEYNAGKAEYDKAVRLYNQKLAEYEAAKKTLEQGKDLLAEAKAQQAQGQKKLDASTPAYEAVKPLYDRYRGLVESLGVGSTIVTTAEQALNSALSKYGYTSMGTLISEYEAGKAQLAEADQQIKAGEQQIADGEKQLAAAKIELDKGKAQLADAKKQLDAGKAQLDKGKAELNNAKGQLADGKKTMSENSEKMADALDSLKEYDDAERIVKSGIEILLENEGIADKVTDRSDYSAVLDAAREYLEEDTENINKELDIRQQLYSLLRIISIIGVIAGIVCLLSAYNPNRTKLRLSVALAAITAIGAIALNIFGFMKGYQYFVYALADGSGSGKLQNISMIVLLVVSAIAAIIAVSCMKAYKTGYGIETAEDDSENAEEENSGDSVIALPEKMPEPEASADNEAEKVDTEKTEKTEKAEKAEKTKKTETKAPHTKSKSRNHRGQATYKPSKENRVYDDEYSAAYIGEKPNDTPAEKTHSGHKHRTHEKKVAPISEPTFAEERELPKPAHAPVDTDRLQSEYELARKEFEEARRKYEEARNKSRK